MSQVPEKKVSVRPALHHISLKMTRMQEMIDWYDTTVGMKANYDPRSPM